MAKTICYGGSDISVSDEVADFLERDRKRQAAQDRSDRRHTSKRDSEPVPATAPGDPTWDAVLRSLALQKLCRVTATLSDDERKLLVLRFQLEWSMENIGKYFGVSKMAISKRLKKLLGRMRELMET